MKYRSPITVFLNITNLCNLRCVYCSADAGERSKDELSEQETAELVEMLVRAKVCHVIVTGGELFMRRDWRTALARLRQAKMRVTVNTNGTLLTAGVCRELIALGISGVSVSLDGATCATNDSTRGEGSFNRATAGVRELVRAGTRPAILLTLTNRNWHQLKEVVALSKALGAASVSITHLGSLGRGSAHFAELALTRAQTEAVGVTIHRLRQDYPGFVHDSFLYWRDYPIKLAARPEGGWPPGRRSLLPCGAATTACAITADGWVMPCNKFENYRCGNVRTTDIMTIWTGPKMEAVRRLSNFAVQSAPVCGDCQYNDVCSGGCRAEAFNCFGDLTGPDPACAVLPDSAIHRAQAARNPASGCTFRIFQDLHSREA